MSIGKTKGTHPHVKLQPKLFWGPPREIRRMRGEDKSEEAMWRDVRLKMAQEDKEISALDELREQLVEAFVDTVEMLHGAKRMRSFSQRIPRIRLRAKEAGFKLPDGLFSKWIDAEGNIRPIALTIRPSNDDAQAFRSLMEDVTQEYKLRNVNPDDRIQQLVKCFRNQHGKDTQNK